MINGCKSDAVKRFKSFDANLCNLMLCNMTLKQNVMASDKTPVFDNNDPE